MDFKSKPIILASIVVAVSILAAGFWYWQRKSGPEEQFPTSGSPQILQVQGVLSLDAVAEHVWSHTNENHYSSPTLFLGRLWNGVSCFA